MDKDFNLVLKESLRTRTWTRTNIPGDLQAKDGGRLLEIRWTFGSIFDDRQNEVSTEDTYIRLNFLD